MTSTVSYACLAYLLPKGGDEGILFWVGIMLIVSAGSFIYVATIHIMPEVLSDSAEDHGHGHGHGPDENIHGDLKHNKYGKKYQLAMMVAGLLAPLALTFLEDA